MASSGHRDLDLPNATLHRAGSFLADFQEWLAALGYTTWRIEKEPGNHLTNYWVYTFMSNSAPSKKNQVQFGCTRFAAVNPRTHAYARGRAPYLSAAVKLLQKFISEVWAADEEEEQQIGAGEITTEPVQQESWDQFEVLDMRQYKCPSTERVWFSTDDATSWCMPDSTTGSSTCGKWQAHQDSVAGVWWCNQVDRKLFFLAAA